VCVCELQSVAVCCIVLQCVAVCCSVLQCVVDRILQKLDCVVVPVVHTVFVYTLQCVAVCCSMLQRVAAWCNASQTVNCVVFLIVCTTCAYGVASVSRIDKIIGLFCKRAL